jgi:uncharacterized damage-inducible protein DinB
MVRDCKFKARKYLMKRLYMTFDFLVETYATERLKVLSVWSMFRDDDLAWRSADPLKRGRSVHEQMVHQCVSEDLWFKNMLGIDLNEKPLPESETRLNFLNIYADRSGKRLEKLGAQSDEWWTGDTGFFEVKRSRAWVMTRRMTHTAHHRGQLTAYLRMLGRELHSTYGPTSDTGGLMINKAPVIYAYDGVDALLEGEAAGGRKRALPGPLKDKPYTERP